MMIMMMSMMSMSMMMMMMSMMMMQYDVMQYDDDDVNPTAILEPASIVGGTEGKLKMHIEGRLSFIHSSIYMIFIHL